MKTTLIIIRHAEKLDWEGGKEPEFNAKEEFVDNHRLSAKGYERSLALVGYFLYRKEMCELFKKRVLTTLIAQDVDSERGFGKSERPLETITPLLRYENDLDYIQNPLELRLFTKNQLNSVSKMILNGDYDGKSIIICWCHQQIPQMLVDLGIKIPNGWKFPKGRFDVSLVCDLETKQMKQLPQMLMYGDSAFV